MFVVVYNCIIAYTRILQIFHSVQSVTEVKCLLTIYVEYPVLLKHLMYTRLGCQCSSFAFTRILFCFFFEKNGNFIYYATWFKICANIVAS